jgi:hypothetical protein
MTNTPPAEIQNVIEAHIKAFNTHDDNLFNAMCLRRRSPMSRS